MCRGPHTVIFTTIGLLLCSGCINLTKSTGISLWFAILLLICLSRCMPRIINLNYLLLSTSDIFKFHKKNNPVCFSVVSNLSKYKSILKIFYYVLKTWINFQLFTASQTGVYTYRNSHPNLQVTGHWTKQLLRTPSFRAHEWSCASADLRHS